MAAAQRAQDASDAADWRAAEYVRLARRHPVTAGVGLLTVAAMSLRSAGDPVLPAIVFVTVVGVVLARIDIAVRRLPFAVTVPTFAAAAVLLIAPAVVGGEVSLLRAATSSAVWLATYWTIHVASRGRGLGLGDVVLAPTLGLVLGELGWGPSLVGLAAGFLLAAVIGAVLLGTGRATTKAAIPFGPFMLAGAALGVLIGEAAWTAYGSGSGQVCRGAMALLVVLVEVVGLGLRTSSSSSTAVCSTQRSGR